MPQVEDDNRSRNDYSDFLQIGRPSPLDTAPSALQFERYREVEIDWQSVLKKAFGDEPKDKASDPFLAIDTRHLRAAFHRSWGLDSNASPSDFKGRIEEIPQGVKDGQYPGYVRADLSVPTFAPIKRGELVVNRPSVTRNSIVAAQPRWVVPPDGDHYAVLVYQTSTSSRYFIPWIKNSSGQVVVASLDWFKKDYAAAWSAVFRIEQVYYLTAAAKLPTELCPSYCERSDAAAALLLREYAYIEAELDIAKNLEVLSKTLSEKLKSAAEGTLDALLDEAKKAGAQAALAAEKTQAWKQQLLDRAQDLGYIIFFERTTFNAIESGGAVKAYDVFPGQLYSKSQKTVSWSTVETRKSRSIFGSKKKTSVTTHSATFDYYQLYSPDYDPWIELASVYQKLNFSVKLLSATEKGFMDARGTSLETIMEECRVSEDFRRGLVVALPVYETAISGRSLLAAYDFYVRPVPSITVEIAPTISLVESLAYRFAWTGTVLGDLAGSIPLAPGEERQVSLNRTVTKERTQTRTSTSILEVGSIDKSDFENVFENEIQEEVTKESTLDVKASGSYGGAVKGSVGFSETKKTRDLSRTLNKTVAKASRESTRRAKEETSLTFSEKDLESTVESTTYKVKNINEGATLNLMLYRLHNSYKSALRLTGFSITVQIGPTLVMGTDCRKTRVFSQADSEKLGEWLVTELAPWLDQDGAKEYAQRASEELIKVILEQMHREWVTDTTEPFSSRAEIELTSLVNWPNDKSLNWEEATLHVRASEYVDAVIGGARSFETRMSRLLTSLSEITFKPIDVSAPVPFEVDAGALYIEPIVGRDATDLYADSIRALEVEKRRSEVRLIDARAELLRAQAKSLASLHTPLLQSLKVSRSEDGTVELRIYVRASVQYLGEWRLVIGKDVDSALAACRASETHAGLALQFSLSNIAEGRLEEILSFGNAIHLKTGAIVELVESGTDATSGDPQ